MKQQVKFLVAVMCLVAPMHAMENAKKRSLQKLVNVLAAEIDVDSKRCKLDQFPADIQQELDHVVEKMRGYIHGCWIAKLPTNIQDKIAEYVVFNQLNDRNIMHLYKESYYYNYSSNIFIGPYRIMKPRTDELNMSLHEEGFEDLFTYVSKNEIGDYAFSRNGKFFVFLEDHLVNIVSMTQGDMYSYQRPKNWGDEAVAVSSDGTKIALVDCEKFRVFTVSDEPELSFFKEFSTKRDNKNVFSVDFDMRGQHVGVFFKHRKGMSVDVKPLGALTLQQCFATMGVCKSCEWYI